jgi:sucrose-6-phosphate hydrolase SacC (GH32 family)
VQDLAYSTDRGRTWTKYAGNPVLDIGMKDFRDPKVFWHAPTQRWVMVVVLPDERQAIFYSSTNLREWTELSRFDAPFEGQGIWECPDLMELPAEGGGTVWMLKVDALGGHPSGETGARLFFGHFDGHTFKAEPEDAARWADHGCDFYAALSWSNLPSEPWQGRAVWLAWMSCHRYAPQTPTDPWRGAMTVPRQLHARRRNGLWRLVQTPVATLESLRLTSAAANDGQVRTLNLGPGQVHRLLQSTDPGFCAEVQWTLVSVSEGCTPVMRLVTDRGPNGTTHDEQACVVEVGYDTQRGELYIDRSRSGVIPGGDKRYAGRRGVACRKPSAGAPLTIRVWWDWSSVEVLADDGELALTEQCYPLTACSRLELASLGDGGADSLVRCWPLRPAQID